MQNNTNFAPQFISANNRAKYAILLLTIGIGVDAIDILLGGVLISSQSFTATNSGAIFIISTLQGIVRAIESLLTYVIAIFFLVWLYRAYSNLTPLQVQNQSYTPGWAVGWWFIPIASLWMPYLVVKELWEKSDPLVHEETEYWHRSYIPTLFRCWWALWVCSGMVGLIYFAYASMINTGDSAFQITTKTLMLVKLFTIGAGFLCIKIVSGINKRQETRFQKLYS